MESPAQFELAVAAAAAELARGGVAVLPTETVYGLAANAFSETAVESIYAIKGRPAHNPIIVHVASLELARECVSHWPETAALVAREFWPGPLTLVLHKSDRIPSIVTAGGPTVAIRWPSHPFMREVIKRLGFPLAAPSANLSNQVSPTTAAHVLHSLRGKVPLIVDAGPSAVGIESTVLDLSSSPPRILRPGIIHSEEIRKVLPKLSLTPAPSSTAPLKSPGQLKKHYAPHARVVLARWNSEAELTNFASNLSEPLSAIHIVAYEHIPISENFGRIAVIPHDPEAYARALYAEFHQSDQLGARIIIVEEPPGSSDWEGIRDRLRRAAAEG